MNRNDQLNQDGRQRGAALLVCLVLLLFLGTLSGTVIKTVLDDRREARLELIRQQVHIIQKDELRRAELRRQIEPNFSGETIEVNGNPGVFRLTSIYNAKTKTFTVETVFQTEAGKTIFVQSTEQNKEL